MNDTLKTLSQLITPKYEQMSLEQLAEVYTKDFNPCVLASAFSKTFKLIISISHKFFGFSSEDIASFSLEMLDRSLQTFVNNGTLFTTYFTTVFRNKLREESEKLSTDKRKVYMHSTSLDALVDSGFDICTYDNIYDNNSLINSLSVYGLDSREIKYCNLILDGYTNKEISQKLNTSIMTLSNIRKKLRIKLAPMHLEFI